MNGVQATETVAFDKVASVGQDVGRQFHDDHLTPVS
jgi:hypothetical protein